MAPRESDLLGLARKATAQTLQRMPGRRHEYDDILSDAMLGVVNAVKRFDPTRGVPFPAYALRRAHGEILDGMRRRGPLTRHEMNRGVTLDDLPAQRHEPIPLEAQVDGNPWDLPIPDPRAASALDAAEARLVLGPALRALPPRLWYVIDRVYLHERKLLEVAHEIGVTESRVCQMVHEALARMRHTLAA